MLGNYVRCDSDSIQWTKVSRQICRKWNVLFESQVVTSVDRTSFNFWIEDFLGNLPIQTFIYCVTDQPSLNLDDPSHISSYQSLFQLCKVKIFQPQSMLNAIRCIDQRFVFKNSRISCLALIFNMKNPSTTVLCAKNRLQVAKYDEPYTFFSSNWYEPMAEWLRLVAVSRATWVRFLKSADSFCRA